MKKLTVALLLALLILPVFTASASTAHLSCDEGMLTAEERADLETALVEASELSGFDTYAIVCVYDYGYSFSERLISQRLGIDPDSSDAIVLCAWRYGSGYYYELFTFGESYGFISDDDADTILDDYSVRKIKNGDLSTGISAFATVTSEIVAGNRSTRWVVTIVISVLVALGAGTAAILGVYFKYKKKQKSPSYPLSKYARLNLMHADDRFLNSTVTRTRINNSSGSRSGGGGGSSGGSRGSR